MADAKHAVHALYAGLQCVGPVFYLCYVAVGTIQMVVDDTHFRPIEELLHLAVVSKLTRLAQVDFAAGLDFQPIVGIEHHDITTLHSRTRPLQPLHARGQPEMLVLPGLTRKAVMKIQRLREIDTVCGKNPGLLQRLDIPFAMYHPGKPGDQFAITFGIGLLFNISRVSTIAIVRFIRVQVPHQADAVFAGCEEFSQQHELAVIANVTGVSVLHALLLLICCADTGYLNTGIEPLAQN